MKRKLYRYKNKILPFPNILGYLKNHNVIDIDILFNDSSQENKLWYDNGNDYRYDPKVKEKMFNGVIQYYNLEKDVKEVEK